MVNKSYEIISGLKREQVLGKNMRDLVKEDVINKSGTLMAIQRREPVTLEQKFQTGKRAVITSTPTMDENNEVVMVVTNVRDVTELYQLKKQLKQNEKLSQKKRIGTGSYPAADYGQRGYRCGRRDHAFGDTDDR